MPIFKTEKLNVNSCVNGNYSVELPKKKPVIVEVEGTWRSRPVGGRLFTDAEIRQIRNAKGTLKSIAETYDCSSPLIYFIKKRAIYCDVI